MPYETNLNLNECTRRAFLSRSAGIGSLALASLLSEVRGLRAETVPAMAKPQAKSMICLFQHGGPSQMDLFDPKPALQKFHGKPFPAGAIECTSTSKSGMCWGLLTLFERTANAAW